MTAVTTFPRMGQSPLGSAETLSSGMIGLAVRLLDRVAPERDTTPVEPAIDSVWSFRATRGRLLAFAYRRGDLAFSPDAARALLDLQDRDPAEARSVLEGIARLARGATQRSGSLFVLGDTLVVGHRPASGPDLLVTHLS